MEESSLDLDLNLQLFELSARLDALLRAAVELSNNLQKPHKEKQQTQQQTTNNIPKDKKEMLALVSQQMDTLLAKSTRLKPPQNPSLGMKKYLSNFGSPAKQSIVTPLTAPDRTPSPEEEYFKTIRTVLSMKQERSRLKSLSSTKQHKIFTNRQQATNTKNDDGNETPQHSLSRLTSSLSQQAHWITSEMDISTISDATLRHSLSQALKQNMRELESVLKASRKCLKDAETSWTSFSASTFPFLKPKEALETKESPSTYYYTSIQDLLNLQAAQIEAGLPILVPKTLVSANSKVTTVEEKSKLLQTHLSLALHTTQTPHFVPNL
jgi:hypothetical protein